ncbi:MAG: CsgG/HfaB family protein [Gloeomargarita sp. HHBFW_bins_162]
MFKALLVAGGLVVSLEVLQFVNLPISRALAQGVGLEQIQVQTKRRIAVLDFDFASTGLTGLGLSGSTGPAKAVSDLLTNRLVQNGTYIVIERSKINQILAEQNLGASGRIELSTAAQVGRLLGADVVVIGTITQFGVQESRSATNIGIFNIVNVNHKQTADVKLTARIVSTVTAEILAVAEGVGTVEHSSGGTMVGQFGNVNVTDARDKILSDAAERAISQVVEAIAGHEQTIAALPLLLPDVVAIIADVTQRQVIINKGAKDGLKPGMLMSVERVVREVKDPQTGKVLHKHTQPIGRIQLTKVEAGSAIGQILAGQVLKVGDIAKPTQ